MGQITALGVGLTEKQLTFEAAELLGSGAQVLLHTGRIGCAEWLSNRGIPFEALDALYDACEDFDEHASLAAQRVISMAENGDVVYAVYDVRDRSVLKLAEMEPKLRVVAGPPVEGALMGFADGATRMLEASDWESFRLSPMDNALVRELNSRELASEVKLRLMDCYPDETRCIVLNGDGSLSRVPLYDLDRLRSYDHRSCALIPAQRDLMKLERFGFGELVHIMRILQGPNGCPWDRAQTHESLRSCMLEEVYEVIDAINDGDMDHLFDELGDVLMQVVLHAGIGEQHGEFNITDTTTAICRKMIDRHSHIFGSDSAQDSESVLNLWMKNKMKERGQAHFTDVLREVSHGLPALMRATKLLDKAKRAGVGEDDAVELARDAQAELKRVADEGADEKSIGDTLLMLCALARARGVDAEIALNAAADRFIDRFEALEKEVDAQGEPLDVGEARASERWNRVKL